MATTQLPGQRFSPEEFDGLVATHQEPVWRYLRFLGAEGHQAEDLLQETFLAVWKQPFEVRDPGSTRGYLFTVARNQFLMAARRQRVRSHFEDIESADAAWAPYAADGGDEYIEHLRSCVAGLSGRGREAVRLSYEESRSRDEIGTSLNLSRDGVKTLMRRIRQELKACVERRLSS